MKERLQEAMPDVTLHELREQREIHENQDVEADDEQELMHENQDIGQDIDMIGTATNIRVQQCGISLLKCLKNIFKRSRFGLQMCNVNNVISDATMGEEPESSACYGNNVDSDSENEGNFQEGLPLVRT